MRERERDYEYIEQEKKEMAAREERERERKTYDQNLTTFSSKQFIIRTKNPYIVYT